MRMLDSWRLVPAAVAAAGLVAGGFLAGWLVCSSGPPSARPLPIVHAVSSLMDENFAVCTAAIDGATEGFFILDFQTGDLTGGVLAPTSSKFTRVYSHNVLRDLEFEAGAVKNPKFLLVSGLARVMGPTSNQRAQSVLYVTNVATGLTAAYGIPWVATQANAPGRSELVLLDVARPRGGAAAAP